MEERLTVKLDECLARLKDGESLESCLSRYSEDKGELEPLLLAAARISALPAPCLPAEEVHASRLKLEARLTRIAAGQARRPGFAGSPFNGWRLMLPAVAASLAALAFIAYSSGLIGPLSPHKAEAAGFTLNVLQGEVYATGPGGAPVPAQDAQVLGEGARVETKEGSYAIITFFEGSTLRLEPETVLEMEEMSFITGQYTRIALRQLAGRTWSAVAPLVSNQSYYLIETISSRITARGTLFSVEVSPTGATAVNTVEGTVSVEAAGQTVQVGEDQKATVESGKAPLPAPAAPVPITRLDIISTTPAVCSLTEPTGASTGYFDTGLTAAQIMGAKSALTNDGRQTIAVIEPKPGRYVLVFRNTEKSATKVIVRLTVGVESVFEKSLELPVSQTGWSVVLEITREKDMVSCQVGAIAPLQGAGPEKVMPSTAARPTAVPRLTTATTTTSTAPPAPAITNHAPTTETKPNVFTNATPTTAPPSTEPPTTAPSVKTTLTPNASTWPGSADTTATPVPNATLAATTLAPPAPTTRPPATETPSPEDRVPSITTSPSHTPAPTANLAPTPAPTVTNLNPPSTRSAAPAAAPVAR